MTRHPQTTDARKLFGQNFLRSGPFVARLVREAAITSSDVVVEIGGGGGAITRALAATGCQLLVAERDPQFVRALIDEFAEFPQVTVVPCDVRELTWPKEPFRVFANIPFGLTTEIMKLLLDDGRTSLARADLIVQAEVARKRTATPTANRLNLSWAPWWLMVAGRRISAAQFSPRPRVDGAILTIERRPEPLVSWAERPLWVGLLDEGFTRGRQPARRALASVLTATQLRRMGRTAGIDLDKPVTRLDFDEWIAIHSVVREHVPTERWPRTRPAPRSGGARTRSGSRRSVRSD